MQVAEHWIRFGADGWRLDVAAEIDDDDFWREFRRRVKAIDPEAYIVAEVWVEDPRWLHGDQFDAYMNYPLGFAALGFAAGSHRNEAVIQPHDNVRDGVTRDDGTRFLARVERQLTVYDAAITAVQLNLLGSHDMPRILTIADGDLDAVRLATLVQLTLPGAPCIYYGDEIGMAGAHDPYCRGPFPADEAAWNHELRSFVRGLIHLRHARPVLRSGRWSWGGAAGSAAAYSRSDAGELLVVALNAGEEPVWLEVGVPGEGSGRLEPVVPDGWAWPAGDPADLRENRAWLELPARSARILRRV
jgi:neopullulanase